MDHPLVPRGEPELVASDDALSRLIEKLRRSGSFAYDSEFIGELTYFPKLCLIQVASRDHIALIDPLANLSLSPFWELLCDQAVEKIVHAGAQDIEPVIRHTGRSPEHIFDTQVCAGFAAMPYPVSLSKLVMELTGARLGKGLTFSHWDKRPLSAMQLHMQPMMCATFRWCVRKLAIGSKRWGTSTGRATVCGVVRRDRLSIRSGNAISARSRAPPH